MARQKTDDSNVKLIEIRPMTATITITGTNDLVLNKMGDATARALAGEREGKTTDSDQASDYWEDRITSMHWVTGVPSTFNEDVYNQMVDPENKIDLPCITCFGLKKSWKDAVVRNEIATWATKFDATVFPVGVRGDLIPVDYTDHYVVKKLMQPKKGKPVLSTFNVFKNWKAVFRISYIPNVYSLEQIVNIINLAGFGLGVGSRRPCGYGRYTVTNVE